MLTECGYERGEKININHRYIYLNPVILFIKMTVTEFSYAQSAKVNEWGEKFHTYASGDWADDFLEKYANYLQSEQATIKWRHIQQRVLKYFFNWFITVESVLTSLISNSRFFLCMHVVWSKANVFLLYRTTNERWMKLCSGWRRQMIFCVLL